MTRKLFLIVVPALLACSCAAVLVNDYWTGDLIKVPHGKHGQNDVACISCHETIWDATDLSGNHRPPESKCLECHQEAKDKGDCQMCHTDAKKAKDYPKRERQLIFSHKSHVERVKEDCAACHKVLPEPTRSRNYVPTMDTCNKCHIKDYNDGKCEMCHTELSKYPLKPIADFSHRGNFVKEHGRPARAAADSCAACHEQTFCADCHAKTAPFKVELKFTERVNSDFIHRNDFLSRHSSEAKFDPVSCRRCHGTSFCENCHTANNLTSRAPTTDVRNPHPSGWAFPGSANSHGAAARRDINSCASCHDQGARSNCVDCHKVGGVGGNPHPPGWSDRHPRESINQNGMCRYCHN